MKRTKVVGIRELENNLSAYLREVKLGTRILVKDGDVVVAELREPSLEAAENNEHPLVQYWIEKGWLRPATRPKTPMGKSPISLPDGTAKYLLDLERGE